MTLTTDELARYQRHLSLPDFDIASQQQLKAAKVLCIGAGGIGSPLLLYLATAGIGNIAIVDHDHVELSNLQRQIIFTEQDIGQAKAAVACNVLQARNPHIQVTPYCEQLNADNAATLIANYDLVIDGSDNFTTRYLINDSCVTLEKPFISAMVFQHQAMAARFNLAESGCYRCLFPQPPSREALPDCNTSGVLGPTVGIIGALAANLAIHTLIQTTTLPTNLLTRIDSQTLQWQSFHYEKNANCRCQQHDKQIVCRQSESEDTTDVITMISAQQLKTMMAKQEKFLLIDVREDWERAAMSIDGSQHIPLAAIADWQPDDYDTPVILFCHSDVRSYRAAINLHERGYKNSVVLKHGISGF
ncbi:MAG: hypothetical protein GY782_11060 [Gammaproteobacteria bacterium]|nr:hypothetical protein [Gammaproteobacteria bacterium]